MTIDYQPLTERIDIDIETFRNEIMPSGQPVVLRGIVKDWRVTQAAKRGAADLASLLEAAAGSATIEVMSGEADIQGRFFYDEAMTGFNFRQDKMMFKDFIREVMNIEIYIPALWWHHVRAMGTLNVLMNYWWSPVPQYSRAPLEALVLSLLAVRQLPAAEREAWKNLFDYFIFQTDGPPMERRWSRRFHVRAVTYLALGDRLPGPSDNYLVVENPILLPSSQRGQSGREPRYVS